VIITMLTFAVSTVIVTRLAFAASAVIVAGLAFAPGNIGVATLVVTAFAMAAVVITGFALAASNTGVAALVITAFAMAAVIVTGLTLAASECGHAASIIAPLVVPMAAIITAAVESHVIVARPASHRLGALSARNSAARDALMDGPVMHASAATAHAHAGRTPAARLTVATGEECKPGCDYCHSRAHDYLFCFHERKL